VIPALFLIPDQKETGGKVINMDYKKGLALNPKLFYIANFFIGLSFTLPIWVLFYQRHLSLAEIGVLNGFYYAVGLFLELPTGALADIIGRKKTILLGYLIIAIGYFYTAFSFSFVTFGLAYLIRAIGDTFVSGADTALVYDSYKEMGKTEEFPKQVAKGGFIYRMGLVVGSLTGGFLYTVFPGLPFIAVGIAQLIALAILFFLVEPHIDSVKFTLKNYIRQTREGFVHVFKTEHMKKLTMFYVLVGGVTWSCLIYFNQMFATYVGFEPSQMGLLFGGVYMVSSTAVLYISHHRKLITRERVYLGLPLLMAIAYIPAVLANKVLAVPIILLMIFTGSGRFAFLDGYVNEEFESRYRATAISSLNMMVNIFVVLIVGASGFIQEKYGTSIILTVMGIVVAVFLIPMGFRLLQEYRRISPSGGQSSDR